MSRTLSVLRYILYPLIIWFLLISLRQDAANDFLAQILSIPLLLTFPIGPAIYFLVVLLYSFTWWIDLLIIFFNWRKGKRPSIGEAVLITTALLLLLATRLQDKQAMNNYFKDGVPRCKIAGQPLIQNSTYFTEAEEERFKATCEAKPDCIFTWDYPDHLDIDSPKRIACCPQADREAMYQEKGKYVSPECVFPGWVEEAERADLENQVQEQLRFQYLKML